MQAYLTRRLLLLIPTLLLITIIIFSLVRFIPGSVIDLMVSEIASEIGGSMDLKVTADSLRQELGLDVPIHIQYGRWLAKAARGDLGRSLWTNRSITETIGQRLPISLELGIIAMLTMLIIAIPIGVYSAIRQDSWGDYGGRTFAILNLSVPAFWTATIVIVYPAIWWSWSPSMEYLPIVKDLAGNLLQFLIPGIIMGSHSTGTIMRITRTMMLEVLRQDYIRTAWAKGLSERTVILRHTVKNALIPVITLIGNQLPVLIGGSVVMEQVFALPGIGRFLVEAINRRDYPVIQAVVLVTSIFTVAINLVVDLAYAYVDPRIQYK